MTFQSIRLFSAQSKMRCKNGACRYMEVLVTMLIVLKQGKLRETQVLVSDV